MSHHHWGQTVEIFGIESPTNGHCCEEHTICGAVLTEDCVVRFRKVQVFVNEKEESANAVFWVSDGVDWCHIGFLPQHQFTCIICKITITQCFQFPNAFIENWHHP